MNKILLFLITSMLVFNSCLKDNSGPSSADPKAAPKVEDMSVQTNFDWKTAKEYTISLSGSSSRSVQIVSSNGAVYYKAYLLANTLMKITVTLPAYEKSVQMLYNGQNIALPLTSADLTYSFK